MNTSSIKNLLSKFANVAIIIGMSTLEDKMKEQIKKIFFKNFQLFILFCVAIAIKYFNFPSEKKAMMIASIIMTFIFVITLFRMARAIYRVVTFLFFLIRYRFNLYLAISRAALRLFRFDSRIIKVGDILYLVHKLSYGDFLRWVTNLFPDHFRLIYVSICQIIKIVIIDLALVGIYIGSVTLFIEPYLFNIAFEMPKWKLFIYPFLNSIDYLFTVDSFNIVTQYIEKIFVH